MNGSWCCGFSGTSSGSQCCTAATRAVLCAECDVVRDSPHDVCLICGSHSLFNIARVFGGKLPQRGTSLIAETEVETSSRELVLPFPKLTASDEGDSGISTTCNCRPRPH